VTKTGTPSPLYPTSAAVVATGFLPPANSAGGGGWQTTVTQSGTFSVSSMENQVCFSSNFSFGTSVRIVCSARVFCSCLGGGE